LYHTKATKATKATEFPICIYSILLWRRECRMVFHLLTWLSGLPRTLHP